MYNIYLYGAPARSRIAKFLIIMKLSFLFLIIPLIQVTASTKAQTITLNKQNTSITSVFEEIMMQTDYDFSYSEQQISKIGRINISVTNASITEVLDKCFKGQPITYTIENKTITIKTKERTLLDQIVDHFTVTIVTGSVTDTLGNPLIGATVQLQGAKTFIRTGEKGFFSIRSEKESGILIIAYIGYKTQQVRFDKNTNPLKVVLKEQESILEEVSVVSTGYDKIPKERATGSFTQLDNALINRSVSTNILDRLDGVTSGLIFTTGNSIGAPRSTIEVRGRSTLFSPAEPLIVVDNFAYEGDLANINPNDIENITVLKDAAAASIWGSRSGNGVIVITTKKGRLNSAPKISLNTNVNIGEKPDLYYSPQLSSSQWIEVEQFLYNKGTYTNSINNGYSALSPAVEIFNAPKSSADSLSQINALKGYDLRAQQLKYLYRPSVNQQYQVSINGGGNAQNYFVSVGYDKNLSNAVGNSYDRITINANNAYYLVKNRLELNTGIIYTGSKNRSTPSAGTGLLYPYSQLADADGNALTIARTLRPSYLTSAGNGKLLNWIYRPLDELENRYNQYTTNLTDYRLNLSVKYKVMDGLSATAYYNYEKGISESNQLNELESYYTRNLINQFTQINATTGAVTYPIPMGSILNSSTSTIKSNNGRFQVNYDNKWNKHAVDVLAGTEIRDYNMFTGNNIFYGYNDDTKTNQNVAVNTTVDYPYFFGTGSGRIVISPSQLGNTNRFLAYYFNGSYTYNDRYIASFSARKDESNIFGVATNQKGVPLWSAGLAWAINKEDFYEADWLPQLKLRATFGYTGNVNNSISAYLTAVSGGSQTYNAYNADIKNPPNPSLRWEKNRNINLGLDFSSKGNRLSGSIDVWNKKGIDLIGNSPIAPQTGVAIYTGNSANTITKGLDAELNSINLDGTFKWYTTVLYNYSQSKVTDYKVSNGSNYNVVSANYSNPLQGYPYYAIFSFKYAGLNDTGNPQGYVNGNVSTDYATIRSSTNRDDLVYRGSAVPTSFGSLRNTFTYKGIDISINITFKLGYYFRRASLDNDALYGGGSSYQMADYDKRWQKAGDELTTNVPALIYPSTADRTSIYTYADVLVEKGDHLRIRDMRLGYTLPNHKYLPFRNLNIFTYINNLGIIWRANKQNIDPDFILGVPSPRTIAFGLKVEL